MGTQFKKSFIFSLVLLITLGSCSRHQPTQKLAQYSNFHEPVDGKTERRPQENSSNEARSLQRLQALLDLDRLHFFIHEYTAAKIQNEKGDLSKRPLTKAMSDFLNSLTIEDLSISPIVQRADLSDANNYNELVWQLLRNHFPNEKSLNDRLKNAFRWEYDFRIQKIHEAFRFIPPKTKEDANPAHSQSPQTQSTFSGKAQRIAIPTSVDKDDQTLNAGHYVSDRMTRAIYAHILRDRPPVEIHVGDERRFQLSILSRGGVVIGEVSPMARNYNKIYLVRFPGLDTPVVTFTNVGGFDRLDQILKQFHFSGYRSLDDVRFSDIGIQLMGDIKEFHQEKYHDYLTMMRHLPVPDMAIIGQKNAIQNAFEVLQKVMLLKAYYETMNLNPDEQLQKILMSVSQKFALEGIVESKPIIERTIKGLEKELETFEQTYPEKIPKSFEQFSYDDGTIEFSDFEMMDSRGKTLRLRVSSNAWGDEINPYIKAIKAINPKRVVYIGTAGAFSGAGFRVGDLVQAQKVYSPHTQSYHELSKNSVSEIPELKTKEAKVITVSSVHDETHAWLNEARKKASLVEVETLHLGEILGRDVETYLLVSDIVGSEETLATATSGARKEAQVSLIARLIEELNGESIPSSSVLARYENPLKIKFFQALKNVLSKKNISLESFLENNIYVYFLHQTLVLNGTLTSNSTTEELEKVIAKNLETMKPFTDKFFLSQLQAMEKELRDSTARNKSKVLYIHQSFFQGTWYPKKMGKGQKNFALITTEKTALIKNESDYVTINLPDHIEDDFLLKLFARSGLMQFGIYFQGQKTGSVDVKYLPTTMSTKPNLIDPSQVMINCLDQLTRNR